MEIMYIYETNPNKLVEYDLKFDNSEEITITVEELKEIKNYEEIDRLHLTEEQYSIIRGTIFL